MALARQTNLALKPLASCVSPGSESLSPFCHLQNRDGSTYLGLSLWAVTVGVRQLEFCNFLARCLHIVGAQQILIFSFASSRFSEPFLLFPWAPRHLRGPPEPEGGELRP